jgi:PAS domain-containing protein
VKQPRSTPAADKSSNCNLPIVGIGCSAGGLEALEKFLTHVPADSGMAIVIVQHLSPDHGSALPQLLQRLTPMTVVEVADGMAVQSGHVYVIPPNHDLSLLHGKLHLLDPASPRGMRLPIDFFLRSLAEDQREKAIAVILSGMGSDGVFGLRDVMEQLKPEARFTLQIYATDLDHDAVMQARRGCYPDNIAADVSPERLARNFLPEEGGGYRIGKAIREMVVFAPQNIISDPPFTKLDLVSCRNLLIYFGAQVQKQLLPMFHYALNPGGLLLLGSAETIGNFGHLFSPINNKARLFRRLEPAAGKTNMNIHAMAREGLREALMGMVRKAMKESHPVHLNGLRVGTDGGTQIVDVTLQAVERPAPLRGRVIVVFRDVPTPPARRGTGKRIAAETHRELEQELTQAREALQVTQEEMQTTVEELKSSNEELQSTNEELQSTNEELTTSKEELQSLNEELQTVNAELQSKVDDLTWVRNDMTNLLNSTEIATVFLDNEMRLRRFTTHATRLFKLIPGDVGRLLSDIVSDLDYPQLQDDAHTVLRTLAFQEKVVTTQDGRWYRVRIMPYRTQENIIDGVVITFIDITEIKRLEAELRTRGA